MTTTAGALLARATTVFDAAQGTLKFRHTGTGANATNMDAGNGKTNGSVVRFNNVITIGAQVIDAVVTTSITSATVDTYDDVTGKPSSQADPLQPNITSTGVGGNVALQIDFYKGGTYTGAGTGTPVTLQNVVVNSYDIDSSGGADRQFQEFSGFRSYELANTTTLNRTLQGDGSVRFQATTTTNNATLAADGYRVRVYYDSISSFRVRAGIAGATAPAYFAFDFSLGPAWTGATTTTGTPAANLTYSATSFAEAAANNGSITATATITLANETFTGTNGAALAGVTFGNVPAGLTAAVTRVDATHVTLSFTGNAAAHANADDIGNVSVIFGNASFTGNNASAVTGYTRADLTIDFADPAAKTTPTITVTPGTYTYNATAQGPLAADVSTGGSTGAITLSYVGTGATTYGPSSTPPTFAGSYTVTASVAADATFNAASSSATAFTIAKKAASVSPTAASKNFGAADPALTGTLSGFIAADNITATYSRVAGETLAGSPYTISATLSPAGALANYTVTSNTANFTIGQATPTITVTPGTYTYNATAQGPLAADVSTGGSTGAITLRYVGTGATTYGPNSTPPTLAGSYTVTASVAADATFSAASSSATAFTIAKKAASVSPTAASKNFGAADPALTGTLSGFIAADNITASYTRVAGETLAGSPYTISATLSPAGALSNYTVTSNTANFTIGQATPTITVTPGTYTYNATAQGPLAADVSTGGSTGAITLSYVGTGATTYGPSTTPPTLAGSYTVTASVAADATFNAASSNATAFTIAKKAASVSPTAASKNFGAADPALTGTLSGFIAADNITATYSRIAGESLAGSPYTISATLSPAGALANYTVTSNTANFTIGQATPTITVTPGTYTYNATAQGPLAADVSTGGSTGAITLSYVGTGATTYGPSTTPPTLAGSYTVTASVAADATFNAASSSATAFTIAKKAASVSPTAASKNFGAAEPALTGTLSGFIAADNITASYTRVAGETLAGSPYTISATLSPAGALANYTVTSNTANFTIGQATPTITVTPGTYTYNATAQGPLAADVSTGGSTGAITLSYVGTGATTYGPSSTPPTFAGSYTVTASVAADATFNAASSSATAFTIAKKAASVSPAAASKNFGAADPALTGTLTGFIAADNITATYSRVAGETLAGSPYTISATLSPAGALANYTVTSNTANFTIGQATPTITVTPGTYTYNATAQGPLAADVSTGGSTGAITLSYVGTGATTYGPSTTPPTLAGSYTVTASVAADATFNAASSSATSFTIAKKAASVSPTAASKNFGAAEPALTGTLSGFIAADNITATYSRVAGETIAGSPYTISAILSPAGALANYTVTSNTANFTIGQTTPTITVTPGTYTYNATAQGPLAADVSTGGSTGAITLSYVGTGATTYGPSTTPPTLAGSYAVTASVAADATFNAASSSATAFTIAKKAASVSPTAASKNFGAADPALTGTLSGFIAADNITASYTRVAGETLAGSPYTISATLSPAGALANYDVTEGAARFTINKATPTITWPQPAPIAYGTPLSTTQLNAVGSVAGTLTYAPTADTVLEPGTHILTVSFMPTDSGNYEGPITATVTLVVDLPPAPAASDDSARAQERSGVANATPGADPQGNLLGNDTGTALALQSFGGSSIGSSPVTVSGQYGAVTLAPDGSFSYAVNNTLPAVESLNVGQSVSDIFEYSISDRFSRTARARLTVTIAGANDAPVAVPIAAQAATAHRPFGPFTVPPFTDVDNATLEYAVSGLPAGIVFDALTRTFSGTPTAAGSFSVTLTATDGDTSVGTTFTLNVMSPPVNVVPAGPISFTGDPARVVGPDGSVFAVSDADSFELTVTLSAGVGFLTLPSRTGLSLVSGCGLNDQRVSVRGLVTHLNAALSQLVYQAPTGFFGQDTITITSTDERGNTDTDRIDPPFTVALATLGGTNVSASIAAMGSGGKAIVSGQVTQFDSAVVKGVTVAGNGASGQLVVGSPTRQDGSVQHTSVSVELTYADGSKETVAVKVTIYNPRLQLVTQLALNPQTSLYEQKVQVTNTTPYVIDSFRVLIPALPNGVTLYSRSTTTATGQPAIEDTRPLQPGEARAFIIEYFAPNVAQFPDPAVTLEINSVGSVASPLGTTTAIDRTLVAPNGRRYLEFTTALNQTYWVQYRDSATAAWNTSPVPVAGTGTSINWLDDGWPKTSSAPTDAREYRLLVTAPTAGTLTLATQPQSAQVAPENASTLRVVPAGPGPFTYQWYRDGAPVAGATAATLSVARTTLADEGDYHVLVNDSKSVVQSQTAKLSLISSNPGRIVNLAVRAQLESAGSPLITGFVIDGAGTRPVLMRCVGETLRSFGLTSAVANPALQVYRGSTLMAENDDWAADPAATETLASTGQVGAFPLATSSRDAAMVRRLMAENYSIQTVNRSGAAGVVLVELYDALNRYSGDSRIANVSTRARVLPGDGALIAGLTIEGNTTLRLMARVIGPGLSAFGVTDALPDPTLSLYAAGATAPLAANDDWSAVQATVAGEALFRRVGAFDLPNGSRDSVIVTRLPPGSYTLVAQGKGAAEGQALIEIYLID